MAIWFESQPIHKVNKQNNRNLMRSLKHSYSKKRVTLVFRKCPLKCFKDKFLFEKSFHVTMILLCIAKNRESIDIIAILYFYDKSTSRWYEG